VTLCLSQVPESYFLQKVYLPPLCSCPRLSSSDFSFFAKVETFLFPQLEQISDQCLFFCKIEFIKFFSLIIDVTSRDLLLPSSAIQREPTSYFPFCSLSHVYHGQTLQRNLFEVFIPPPHPKFATVYPFNKALPQGAVSLKFHLPTLSFFLPPNF